jgi:hypothetical protein
VKPTGVGSFEALTLEALTLARRTYTRRGMRSSGQRIRDQIAELIAGLITLRVTISSSDDLRPGDQRHHLALAAGEDTRSPCCQQLTNTESRTNRTPQTAKLGQHPVQGDNTSPTHFADALLWR